MGASFVLALIFGATAMQAQDPVQAWVRRYSSRLFPSDQATSIAVGSLGNVFVTGTSYGDSSATGDYATLKYSNSGTPLWTNRYTGPSGALNQPTAIAVDTNENVVVTGYSAAGGTGFAYATLKYSGAGMPLWTNRYTAASNSDSKARAVAIDYAGDVIVTGQTTGIGTGSDLVTLKYSSAGSPLWTNRYDNPTYNNDFATSIAVDRTNNVFVAGYSEAEFGSFVTIKYSGDGVPLWTNGYRGFHTQTTALAVDSRGDVVVSGTDWGTYTGPDYVTIKYSNAGVPLWTNRLHTPGNFGEFSVAMVLDAKNNIFVTGYVSNIITSATLSDFLTIAYSSQGAPLWTNCFTTFAQNHDLPVAAAIDHEGNIVVTGRTWPTNDILHTDYVTVAYSNTGVPLRTNLYDGGGLAWPVDMPTAIAVDAQGNVFVTGYSKGHGTSYTTIKYWTAEKVPLMMQTLEDSLILSWSNTSFALQSAPFLTGTFSDIPGATSPYTNPMSAGQQFFRLISK